MVTTKKTTKATKIKITNTGKNPLSKPPVNLPEGAVKDAYKAAQKRKWQKAYIARKKAKKQAEAKTKNKETSKDATFSDKFHACLQVIGLMQTGLTREVACVQVSGLMKIPVATVYDWSIALKTESELLASTLGLGTVRQEQKEAFVKQAKDAAQEAHKLGYEVGQKDLFQVIGLIVITMAQKFVVNATK